MKKAKALTILVLIILLLSSCGGKNETQTTIGNDTTVENEISVRAKETEADKGTTEQTFTCSVVIDCSQVLENRDLLKAEKESIVPENGEFLKQTAVVFTAGETVLDVSQRVCEENGLPMEVTFSPTYNTSYVDGIGNLYTADCGEYSGWMYEVNGESPNYGCSEYTVKDGDEIHWYFACTY